MSMNSVEMDPVLNGLSPAVSTDSLGYSTITSSSMSSRSKLFGIGELIKAVEEDRRRETMATDENRVKSDISGGWELQSTFRVDEFLKQRREMEIFDLTFRCAQQFFAFPANGKVEMHQKLQGQVFHRRTYQFSEHIRSGHRFLVTYICGHRLKTIIIHDSNNDDVERIESFVDATGRLHIVNKRHYVSCERVYRRIVEGEVEQLRKENEELKAIIDKIVEINGRDCRKMSKEEVLRLVNQSSPTQ